MHPQKRGDWKLDPDPVQPQARQERIIHLLEMESSL